MAIDTVFVFTVAALICSSMEATTYILVGPIASGKSTWARNFAATSTLKPIIFNDDALTLLLHGGDYTSYDDELNPLYKYIETAILTTSMMTGRDVIIDRPNHKATTRRRYVELANAFGYKAVAVVFRDEGAVVHARRRYNSDPRGLTLEQWADVAEKHEMESDDYVGLNDFDKVIHANETPYAWAASHNDG